MKTSFRKKKTLKFRIFAAATCLLVVIVAGYEFLKSSLPPMSGEKFLPSLSAPVEVLRDQHGIPHIKAQNNRDAFRALGYVMASERLFQMEMQRRLANGELAEVAGNKALATDKLFRTLGLKDTAEKLIRRKMEGQLFSAEMLEEAQAFYEGVNFFQESEPLPIEFLLMGIKPRPFGLADSYAFIGFMAYSFGVAITNEPLLSRLALRLGGELVEDLRNEKIPPGNSLSLHALSAPEKGVKPFLGELIPGLPSFEGSNGWVVAAKRSVSGYPLFLNDPHISYSNPGVWFEAHIETPTYETYGHFLAIVPFPILAHTREHAWGFTMSLVDDMDLYREKIDPAAHTFTFKNAAYPLEKRVETIKIKGAKEESITVFKTRHGPVLDPVLEEKSLALEWAFYEEENDPLSSLFSMGRAKSMEEFKKAVASGRAPGLNVLYADKANIGWWLFGSAWKKRPTLKRDFILDGASGEDEILGHLSFEEKPHAENPPEGIIISANARPKNSNPSVLRGDWQPEDRYKTLEALLKEKEKWSVEELKEVQTLNVNFENKLLLHSLLESTSFGEPIKKAEYAPFLDLLRNWDFISRTESAAPALYYVWCQEITGLLLESLPPEEQKALAKTANGWIFFKRVVLDPASSWWKKEPREKVFREAFVKAVARVKKELGEDPKKWEWGELHRVEFVHPIGRVKPFNFLFNLGPYPVSGATQEINNQKSTGLSDFAVSVGPSTRRAVDFAHPEKSWGVLPIGNSGHLLSPFYANQVKPFLAGEYREQLMDVKSDSKDVRFKLRLLPQK